MNEDLLITNVISNRTRITEQNTHDYRVIGHTNKFNTNINFRKKFLV